MPTANCSYSCTIHKETFIFLRSVFLGRQYKHTLKMFLYIIKFISDNQFFTKQDIATALKISESTLGKYMLTLKQLRLYKPIKRSETEIKNDLPRKYKFISKPWLKEIIFFIKNKRMCPFLCKEN